MTGITFTRNGNGIVIRFNDYADELESIGGFWPASDIRMSYDLSGKVVMTITQGPTLRLACSDAGERFIVTSVNSQTPSDDADLISKLENMLN